MTLKKYTMGLKGQLTRTSYLEWDSMLLLLQKLERDGQYKFQLLIAVGSYTALRISDLLKLRWSDVLLQDALELVEGKTKKTRRIKLNPALVEIISILHEKMNIVDDNELLFINKTKTKAINVQYLNRRLKEIAKQYNLQSPENSISSHMFRKTLGRHVWKLNNYSEKSLLLLGDLFNHSSIRVTKIYLGIKAEEISDVYLQL
jgi:integrase